MLNHLHFLDSASREVGGLSRSRAMPVTAPIVTRSDSPEDTVVSVGVIEIPAITLTMASNIGYGWWSHDIGGHMFGYQDEELETRWYQLGRSARSTVCTRPTPHFNGGPVELHSPAREAMIAALRLRHGAHPVPAYDEPSARLMTLGCRWSSQCTGTTGAAPCHGI